jgi:RNA methyltransferase, TrmH family
MPPSPKRGELRAITSLQNERVKLMRSLEMRKVRRETGLFVAEGASVLLTARDRGWMPRTLLFQQGTATGAMHQQILAWAARAKAEILEVSQAVLAKVASKDNPQTMLGVFAQAWSEPPSPSGLRREDVWLALEEVRDPGNLGTIMRTAEATGVSGIILIGACCDPYSREAVRATMGSVFSVPLVRMDGGEFLSWRQSWTGDVVGTHLSATDDFRRVSYRGPALVVMGSEGPGLSDQLAAACTQLIKIPMAGSIDSLNLAIATALMLYQVRGPHLKIDSKTS